MKTETLEKIRNILEYLFELFIFILIMLITFGSLHVHAEESNVQQELTGKVTVSVVNDYYGYDGVVTYEFKNNLSLDIYDVCGFLNTSSDSVVPSVTNQSIDFLCKNKKDGSISFVSDAVIITNVSSSGIVEPKYQVGSTLQSFTADQSRKRVDNNIVWYYFYEYDSGNYPIAKDSTSAKNYLLTGDISGIINGGGSIDNPDFEDSAYAFTGFTANNKMTATWTGTTERSYLKDQEVEEYVRVNYYFADKEAQDTIKQADAYPDEFATADKTLTIDVSGLKPDDENWFLRYIRITPCYRQAGLGAWGDFYHGVDCKVYFNQDGSIDKIVRDFPQGPGDYSYKHIFTSDKYSTDIPAPELSAISHNGFTLLNNSNNDYYVDIILESNLYGVKMEKNAGTWLPVVDTDWIYNSHYYNFADTSQIAINNDVIYIPNLFSVNPESDLVDDFKKWSTEYSSYSSLPTMSFLKRSTAARTRYVDQFLFKDDSKYSDSEQLKFSHMAESVFYVRYYNKSMVYGPWVRYKFRDGYVAQVIDGTLGGAYIDVGQVDTDDSGNVRVDEKGDPIVSDNVSGRQDYDTGESDFSNGSFSLDLSDVTKFFDYLKKIFESVTGALSSFGSVVAACFGFLPGELVNALIFGICVMMFIGIIKAVKG